MINSNARAALFALAALALAGAAFAQLGSGDPPIIIGDGSLVIQSPRGGWAQWRAESPNERAFPNADLGIGSLRIESPGNDATVDLSGRAALVTVTSGSTTLDVLTFANGAGIRMRMRGKRFADFEASEDGRTLTLRGTGSISAIQVRRAGQVILQLKGLTPTTKLTFLPRE